MNKIEKPHFVIKKNLQKSKNTGVYFSDVITKNVLTDVCNKITGRTDYIVDFVDNDYEDDFLSDTYNKGRLALLHYKGVANYISFSEVEVHGRNSSVQSVPTAFNMFYTNKHQKKRLFYYFLNVQAGNPETDYLIMMYRLMNTIGFEFLNPNDALENKIQAFTSIEDIMYNRRVSSGRNQGNNSTYITKSKENVIEVYGKVYGASKYESSMICYALSKLRKPKQRITLYEVLEQDLKELPEISRNVIEQMGAMNIIPTDMTLEKKLFEENDSLRSPRYIYNLLEHIGPKHCVLCDCDIPELIQGAHVWPVASIKKEGSMSFEEKLSHAINGNNGLWLCENHHKLFDEHLLTIKENGLITIRSNIPSEHRHYISDITTVSSIPEYLMTDKFSEYLWRRNRAIAL